MIRVAVLAAAVAVGAAMPAKAQTVTSRCWMEGNVQVCQQTMQQPCPLDPRNPYTGSLLAAMARNPATQQQAAAMLAGMANCRR